MYKFKRLKFYDKKFQILTLLIKEGKNKYQKKYLREGTQCPRTDLNKRFLPKPMTTTG